MKSNVLPSLFLYLLTESVLRVCSPRMFVIYVNGREHQA